MSGTTEKEYDMTSSEQKRFDALYLRHQRALKLQGYADKTIDVYSRAVRRLAGHYGCVPDKLSVEQLESYFSALIDSHSWSTVKIDRNGLQFFWKHVLHKDWSWLDIIKPPQVRSLPDILTVPEVERLIASARKLRYRVFVLTTYSMGLRLSETLSLTVADIDSSRGQVHVRRGKGHKDRFVPMPNLTCRALRALWLSHRNPNLLFPSVAGSAEQIRRATTHIDPGSAQKAVRMMIADCGIKKRSRSTRCATVSRPTCSSRALACDTSRPCLVTAVQTPRPFTLS
jgi:integrase